MLYHIPYPCRYGFRSIDLLPHYLISNRARKTEFTCPTKIHFTNIIFEFIYEPIKCRLMLSVGCSVYWIATDGILKHNQTYFRHTVVRNTIHSVSIRAGSCVSFHSSTGYLNLLYKDAANNSYLQTDGRINFYIFCTPNNVCWLQTNTKPWSLHTYL